MFLYPPESAALIDSHCHLDAAEFAADRDAVVADAYAAGVRQIVVPAVSAASWSTTCDMVERYGCQIALGMHPCYSAQHLDVHVEQLAQWLMQHRPCAVGEIGLDGFQPGLDWVRQETLFAAQLRLARQYDLPVLLHIRHAQDTVLKHLRRIPVRGGIAHAFNGSLQQAQQFIALGFKLGFGGAMTYDGSQRIRSLARDLPLSALVLESDAPDMPPSWAQGVRNAPAVVARYAQVLAVLRGISVAEIVAATRANLMDVLGI